MVTSSAFKELSEVLARLESSGTEVRHASVDQEFGGADSDVTAELSVGVPLLADEETSDAVSVDAEGAAVEDGRVAVDLTVTVAAEAAASTPYTGPEPTARGGGAAVPAYKDPEALRTVYEQHDTFPEMTEALGVEVTSETVRRHMVKYDIHDPTDTTPHPYPQAAVDDAATEDTTESAAETAAPNAAESTRPAAAESTVETTTTDGSSEDADARDASSGQDEPTRQSAVTDGGSRTLDAGGATAPSPVATQSVGEVVGAGGPTSVDSAIVPQNVTVAHLAEVINHSRTVHELAATLGVQRGDAREFLQEFGLINFVSHPLATDQITVSPEEVVRRIDNATS